MHSIPSLTLDYNCLIAIDEARPEAIDVLKLIEASRRKEIDVAIVASCASERQPGGGHLDNFAEFEKRLAQIGLGEIGLLKPLGKYDLSFWDFFLSAEQEWADRERLIFRTLFPNTPTEWMDYANENGLSEDDLAHPKAWKWRNQLCDVQAYWAHEFNGRDYFVTSDGNFSRRLRRSADFAKAQVVTPAEAAMLVAK